VGLNVTTAQTTGGSGSDTLISVENLTGSNYGDTLTGNGSNNNLNGGSGADVITGGAGNDTLLGGSAQDTLTGGTGNDFFKFNAPSESGITSTTWDVITDFVSGQDKVDFSAIDANSSTTAADAFTGFISSTASFTVGGQLKFVGGVLYGNTDSDATAEFAVQLVGVSSLTISDIGA
jgi:Ca2+-binding RTX toxin-like protein